MGKLFIWKLKKSKEEYHKISIVLVDIEKYIE